MRCGFVAIVVLAVGTGSTEPGVVGELDVCDIAPGIFIPLLGDGDVAGGIAVGFGVAVGVLGRVGSGQVGCINIGFFTVVDHSAPALVADTSPQNRLAIAQRADDHIVGTGARANIHGGDSIHSFIDLYEGFHRGFCGNLGCECRICVGFFRYRRLSCHFRRSSRLLGSLGRCSGGAFTVSGCCCGIRRRRSAFGRTGGFDGTGFSRILRILVAGSKSSHHTDSQEQGQDFHECVVFH